MDPIMRHTLRTMLAHEIRNRRRHLGYYPGMWERFTLAERRDAIKYRNEVARRHALGLALLRPVMGWDWPEKAGIQ